MDKDNALVHITPDDIAFIERELATSRKPATQRELAEKLAFLKTAKERTQEVKIYDAAGVYQVGDSIYKDYDEPLTVSSKTVEHFTGAVVLTVVKKIPFPAFQCDMLEVDYTGGGTFRRYIDYMKKTKTQVLLPSNVGNAGQTPRVMGRDADPRLTELPMTDRDLKTLEKNLRATLAKSPAFFSWNDAWQLTAHQPAVPEEKIQELVSRLTSTRESIATADVVRILFGLEPSSDLFDIHCLTLNHLFETKGKKEFILVSPVGWGKWHLKAILASLPEHLPISAPEAPQPAFEPLEPVEVAPFHEFPLKVYLSWREILSGAVRIPKAFNKDLAHAREYVFTDADENKSVTVFYFPQEGLFLGLKDYFAANNIPQGTSMTLERKGPVQFHFWLKKSKKKLSVAKLAYDADADVFSDAGEVSTLALPNKIIYLERDTLTKLIALTPQREGFDLKQLLLLVFKTFSPAATNHALHYLRAYHLVDILRRTSQDLVELTLLNSVEFSKSDKKKGIFHYHEIPPVRVEAVAEEAEERPAEALAEEAAAETPAYELPEVFIGEEEAAAPPAPFPAAPKPPAGAPAEAKKEKPYKKKKGKAEGEKAPRARKSERRVIEERIVEEESEQEALLAEKAAEEEELEAAAAELEPAAQAPAEAPAEEAEAPQGETPKMIGGMFGNLFAEKLKSALTKKRAEDADQKDKDEGPKT
jgi:hypothetical protein